MKISFLLTAILFASTLQGAEIRNNVVILLDTSSSMEEQMRSVRKTKWQAAKDSLLQTVSQIPENTNIGLLLFEPEGWKYPLGPVDKDKLIYAINQSQITPSSGTPLGTYMKAAVDQLLDMRDKSFGYGSYKLLVITDGDPTNEPNGLVDEYLVDILSRGIRVECIGVDMAQDSILSVKVDNYMSADDPESLTKQIQETVLAELPQEDSVQGFEEIAALPDTTAAAIIETLSTTGNYPIGEDPPQLIVQEEVQSVDVGIEEKTNFFRTVAFILFFIVVVLVVAKLFS